MDTNKMRDISREQFEEWHKRETAAFIAAGYLSAAHHMECFKETMLATWQASRAAVVVDLPSVTEFGGLGGVRYWTEGQVLTAIEAQGLKVAP